MAHIKKVNNIITEYYSCFQNGRDDLEYIADDAQELLDFLYPDKYTLEGYKDKIRRERDSKLANSDKYKLSDFPKGAVTDAQINTYRQALREIIASITEIDQVITWPTDPLA